MRTVRLLVGSAIAVAAAISGCGPRETASIIAPTGRAPAALSPASYRAAPMAVGPRLPGSAMRALTPRAAIAQLGWTQIPGAATQLAVAPDGSLWALSTVPLGADKQIWHYSGGQWTNIPGAAAHIAVSPDGALWAVNSQGGIYAYRSGQWTQLAGGASDITVTPDGNVEVLSSAPATGDRGIWRYANGQWTQLPGAGSHIVASWDPSSYAVAGGSIAAGGFYVLNSAGQIYYYNGSGYVQLSGAAIDVAPTTNGGTFVLGLPPQTGYPVYYFDLQSGTWTKQAGAAIRIATDGKTLYAVSPTGGGIYAAPVNSPSPSPTPSPTPSPSPTPPGGVSLSTSFVTGNGGIEYLVIVFTNLTNTTVNVPYIGTGCSNAGNLCTGYGANGWNGETTVTPMSTSIPINVNGNPNPYQYPSVQHICYQPYIPGPPNYQAQPAFLGAGSSQCH